MATRGFENFTQADVARLALRRVPKAARSKYGAVKTTADGIAFDSAKEARRYQELKALEHAGHIIDLSPQTPFRIAVNDVEICRYYADFTYKERIDRPLEGAPYHFSFVVEDVKSSSTRKKEVYRLKKKLVEALYGFTIRET